jgi:hypothetical protein
VLTISLIDHQERPSAIWQRSRHSCRLFRI